MKAVAVIPARYGSTRFPGKPLANIKGKAMIEHVYLNVQKAESISEVWIATDDQRIIDKVEAFGGKCILTRGNHQTGTDRIAECLSAINADIIINVQGDEPLIDGKMLDELIQSFKDTPDLQMATFKSKIIDSRDVDDPNVVKVITNSDGKAIYFSRSPIPYNRDMRDDVAYYKHIGVYAYKKSFLSDFVKLQQSSLELSESLEQLRALENGISIKVVETDHILISVDTPEDLKRVEDYLDKSSGVE
ncbi:MULTISPECIES: 3-deoxy-manno-octulosonate cytidylyltransferase [Paenibacillus]|uniref:3-deoxy-manno-octulosonate cytidylyltransferase n=1 Tax=Paenibacillus lautus TaxID=1401 RepID=A0A1R1ALR5_PAELA|nr:3-deoxy-manno-octulosonate cytidylyltransferase [Paenibacillus lautus]OME86476.1 3-deoxy-manno-octulosonate cytidylyltransferase [Paenibacillus lautus]